MINKGLWIKVFFVAAVFAATFFSCTHKPEIEDGKDKEEVDTTTLISYYNGTLSHNQGKNCQSCHQKSGNAKGWFSISGTVYDTSLIQVFPNSTVRLYDGLDSTGVLISTIEVDSFGNFYSTEKIDFKNGLHVEVEGKLISAKMGSLIRSAACNKCHGVTTNRIWTK